MYYFIRLSEAFAQEVTIWRWRLTETQAQLPRLAKRPRSSITLATGHADAAFDGVWPSQNRTASALEMQDAVSPASQDYRPAVARNPVPASMSVCRAPNSSCLATTMAPVPKVAARPAEVPPYPNRPRRLVAEKPTCRRTSLLEKFTDLSRRPVKITLASAAAAAFAGSAAATLNHYYWAAEFNGDYFLKKIAARLRPGVYSPDGKLLGVLPPAANAEFALDEVTVAPISVPEPYIEILRALEDRHAGDITHLHVCGVDWLAILPRALSGHGASSLAMQVVTLAVDGKQNFKLGERKLREYSGACEIWKSVDGDINAIARAYAAIAPIARGKGGDIRGITMAADVLFGSVPERLTIAQLAILAAAPWKPIHLGRTDGRARSGWEGIKRRAITGAKNAFEPELAAPIIAEIQEMGPLPPIRPMLEGLPEAATYSLAGRTRALVLPIMPAIRADLPSSEPSTTDFVINNQADYPRL